VLEMIETTLEIRLADAGDECAVASNAAGDLDEQAQLVAFAHYATRIAADPRLRVPPRPSKTNGIVEYRAVARFVDAASGPRMYFRLTAGDAELADRSVAVAFAELYDRWAGEERLRRTLELASELLARLGAPDWVRRENEFDLALAVADVAWRAHVGEARANLGAGLECPACGNTDDDEGFELRVWPSDSAVLRRCLRCGAGLWHRGSRRVRLLRDGVWSAMESLRAELGVISQVEPSVDGGSAPLLGELKRAFADNGWPYTEVRGAPVLVGVFSGPASSWSFYAQAVEDKGLILLYSICPQRAPEERRREVAEFLTRTNYGLAAGNFELDFDDGEIRYKSVLQTQGDGVDAPTLKRLVRANGIAMETFLPGIANVIGAASSESSANPS
jgi:Zn ribbon nucleic-acid-binding protein